MNPARLWHGGAPGRRPGDLLLSPAARGVRSTLRQRSIDGRIGAVVQREELVYVTSDRELAWACAGVWSAAEGQIGGGTLYQVSTEHELEEDEDLPGLGISFQVPSAVVVAVIDAYVPRDDRRWARRLQAVLSDLE